MTTRGLVYSDTPAGYQDGSFMIRSSGPGPIMPYPVTVRDWSPGMGDMPPSVPFPVMPLPRVVRQWTPGMGDYVPGSALKPSLIAAAALIGIAFLAGEYRKKRRRP